MMLLKSAKDFKSFLIRFDYVLVDETVEEDATHYLTFTGNGLIIGIGFSEDNYTGYKTLNNRIAFESRETFNKWSQVPFSLLIPIESKKLLKFLDYAVTEEAIEKSNKFEVIDWDGLN